MLILGVKLETPAEAAAIVFSVVAVIGTVLRAFYGIILVL